MKILLALISIHIYAQASMFIADDLGFINKLRSTEVEDKVDKKEQPLYMKQAIYKVNQCIKYKKFNETFWKNHETPTFLIEAIGKKMLKVKKYIFMEGNVSKWTYDISKPYVFQFNQQNRFTLTECPSQSDFIDPSEMTDKK